MKYPVLLLDDDNNWLTIYTRRLPQELYTIESTTSLPYALERIKDFPFPVIVSDLRLIGFGNTGGFRLLDEAKKKNWYTKVIIITAFGGAATLIADKAIEKGAFDYLTKPVDFSELDECITAAINSWEQEIEECMSLGFLQMDYISQLFNRESQTPRQKQDREMSPDTARVFISYASCDSANACMIAEILRKNNIPLWFDRKNIGSGDFIFPKINEANKEGRIMLVMLSEEAIKSGWVHEEVDAIFRHYVNDKKIKIIPLLLDDVEVPPLLAGKKALDLKTNAGEKIPELIDMIKKELESHII